MDNGNGQYSVTFTPHMSGYHELIVLVDNDVVRCFFYEPIFFSYFTSSQPISSEPHVPSGERELK